MKSIIVISIMMLIFGAASAKNVTYPADKPESSAQNEYKASEFMLDSLQALSEKTPFRDFAYLDERVKQKLMDMKDSACDQKN